MKKVYKDRVLNRNYKLDWRSLDYPVSAVVPQYRPRSYTWSIKQFLDQESSSACVGFSFAHDLIARPQEVKNVTAYKAQNIYSRAQEVDEWDGEDYDGTSVLAGAKILAQDGYYEGYYWGLTIDELAKGLGYLGPCVLGLNWYQGMFFTDRHGFIHPTGQLEGGHAILAHAIKIKYKFCLSSVMWWRRSWADVDWDKSYVVLHNSWGTTWGDGGRAKITLRELDRLLNEQGDACFPRRTTKTD